MPRHHLPEAIAELALDLRAQIAPRIAVTTAVPLAQLVRARTLRTPFGPLEVGVATDPSLSDRVWGLTTTHLEDDRAVIWLNGEAWDELPREVPRTRFTVAHELGHVMLHAEELDELDVRPEPEHHARIEREANRFAAQLLIPDAALKRLPGITAEALARRFGVSVPAAARRLEER